MAAVLDEAPRPACLDADPELFFPDASLEDAVAVELDRAYCSTCPVRDACLERAMELRHTTGVWAGTSTDERRRRARRLRDATAAARASAQSAASAEDRATVARLTAAGLTAEEIALRTGVSPRTVLRHRATLRKAS